MGRRNKHNENLTRQMSFELALAEIDRKKDAKAINADIVKAILVFFTVVSCISIIMIGLYQIMGQSEEQINALATLVDSFKLTKLFGLLGTGVFGAAYAFERSGKKRAVKEKGKYQRIAEAKDPNRSSSNLDEKGNTPK